MRTFLGSYACEVLKMNENFEIVYISRAKVPKPVEHKGILWASPRQVPAFPPPPSPQGPKATGKVILAFSSHPSHELAIPKIKCYVT